VLTSLKKWIASRRAKPLDRLLAVEFDDHEIRVRVLEDLDPSWNQTFEWSNIRRVCFKDGGMWSSDVVYVSMRHPDIVHAVPTEARGGHEFFGALCDKDLFPEAVRRRAVGDTTGGLHCWPED
jgi:hypothetical protein